MKALAICWPPKSRRIRHLATRGRIPVRYMPRNAEIPGCTVALVEPDGTTRLTCVLRRVEGPKSVLVADGEFIEGYELVAKRGTIRITDFGKLSRLRIRWRALGQFRYFDDRTGKSMVLREFEPDGEFLDPAPTEAQDVRFKRFVGGVPGRDCDHPESRLVQHYVSWIGSELHFLHAQALPDGGYTDLFNTTRWTLFEAKASSDDRRIREAFGQLYDYRRSFSRSPSLAVLLPEAPRPRMRSFLTHFGVAAVWRRADGTFSDSVGGSLTRQLRAHYRRSLRSSR